MKYQVQDWYLSACIEIYKKALESLSNHLEFIFSPISKPVTPSSVEQKVKRNRLKTQKFESPIPEIELISKLTANEANNSSKNSEDKLIIFYK